MRGATFISGNVVVKHPIVLLPYSEKRRRNRVKVFVGSDVPTYRVAHVALKGEGRSGVECMEGQQSPTKTFASKLALK